MKENDKDTERLILDAAVKEFSAKGYDGARISSIAAQAGVTHAMLYYYFRTKEKLFERIFKDKIEYILNMVITPMVESRSDIRDRVAYGVSVHFDFLMKNRDLPIFFITTLNSRPELYNEIREKLLSTANRRISYLQFEFNKAMRNGEICNLDVCDLLADIASLNVMPFLAAPIMMPALGYNPEDEAQFFADRKKENIEIILKRLS